MAVIVKGYIVISPGSTELYARVSPRGVRLGETRFSDCTMPELLFDEQTRLSWAKILSSPGQVPEAYRSFFIAGPGRDSLFPYIVLTPSYAGFLHRAREKLICCSDRQICILEIQRQALKCTTFAYENVSSIEMGTCLLNSWITLRGTTDNGIPAISTFKFNSVTDYLFRPILEKVRPAANLISGADCEVERAKFDCLAQANYKFMSYARRSIRPGAKVIQFVWQPELCTRLLTLFGQTLFHTLACAHMVILTDSELIGIREEKRANWEGGRPYGGIWKYIPLNKIVFAALTEETDDLATLSIELRHNEQVTSLFSGPNQHDAEELLRQIRILAARPAETPPNKKSPVPL